MDLDLLLQTYFGTPEPETLDDAEIKAGIERVTMALAIEGDPGRRFALWVLLYALDEAPPAAKVFKDPEQLRAAEEYERTASRLEDDD
ncbi:hypothetical protein PQ455_17310 [Sphingomonas naphthae]|uniref:Uncharacterized protein n=1 Tax=Sphingomonas naphthae TaxID=1813468 RepID=A0ABY7TLS3_9SPHN|nr:hypothetical protein [Sphingomonas naphthae]WCT73345.1 hypothetical protein PQ455_17310 [Sphingomonas naphthae]